MLDKVTALSLTLTVICLFFIIVFSLVWYCGKQSDWREDTLKLFKYFAKGFAIILTIYWILFTVFLLVGY